MNKPPKRLTRIQRAIVIGQFSSDWHSGQWSRGYRLNCITMRYLENHGIIRYLDDWSPWNNRMKKLYSYLVENYHDKM